MLVFAREHTGQAFCAWRGVGQVRVLLLLLPLLFSAFPLTDGKARRARCALVAFASRLGALTATRRSRRALLHGAVVEGRKT